MLKDVRSRWRPLRRRNGTARRAHHGGQRYRAYQVHHLSCLRGALARQQRACASCTKLCLRTSGPRASPPACNRGSGAHHGDPRDGPCVIRTVQVSQWSSLWVVRMLEADALREGTGRDAAVLWTPLSSWFLVRRGDLLCWILNGEGSAPVALPQHQAESIDSRCTHHELEPSRIHDVLLPSRYMQALRAVS
jgi:hypothetical protein